jgi:NAD(P)-dependent dehydrogenase (short-subunit alcohol dehydrogenase family)
VNLDKYGPRALIVGGSEGIGAAFACKLAAKQFNIVLVARTEQPLVELATELRGTGVVELEPEAYRAVIAVNVLGPILGGPKALDVAIQRNGLMDRGALVASVATPNRTNIPHKGT